jgi:hypothetical protein
MHGFAHARITGAAAVQLWTNAVGELTVGGSCSFSSAGPAQLQRGPQGLLGESSSPLASGECATFSLTSDDILAVPTCAAEPDGCARVRRAWDAGGSHPDHTQTVLFVHH